MSLFKDLQRPSPQGLDRGALFWQFKDEYAVREGEWKLVQTKERPEGVQLYNLAQDLAEEEDLSQQQPEVFNRLMRLHQNWKESMGPTE